VQELEYDYTVFQRPGADDERLYVVFFIDALQDMEKSKEEGRPIFYDAEMVRIMSPGDRNNIIIRPVERSDRARFAKQYAAFKQGEKELIEGTPLVGWPGCSKSQASELAFYGFKTVEQVANANDASCTNVMGLFTLKQRAQEYIKAGKESAPMIKLAEQKELIDMQARQIAEMAEQLKLLAAAQEEKKVPFKQK
jgi:hypothetical protein